MSKKELTPKQKMANKLRHARNVSEEEEKKIQKELNQMDEKITQLTRALPDAPEFKRLQTELIETKNTALTRQESLQKRLIAHLQHKRIYLRLLNLKAVIVKDFVPFVNQSKDSDNLTNPYQYRKRLMGEMLGYATLIRHIQEEISACVQLAADIFRENTAAGELKVSGVEVDALRNLLLQKISEGFLPADGKLDGDDGLKNLLAPEDSEAIQSYLLTLKKNGTFFEKLTENIPNDPEIQTISAQIKSFYQQCQDAIVLAANAYDSIPKLQRDHLAVQNAKMEQKNQEARSRAARIIRDNPRVSGKIKTLKLAIQKYLDHSKGVLKPNDKESKDIELKVIDWNGNQDWATPYNLISQLSRFLQAITHEKVAEIKQGSGFSPPWSLIWRHIYLILNRSEEQIPDENSEILDEFLEIEQSENTSFQELAKRRHKQSIDSRGEENDDDEKSMSTERKQTGTRLRAAQGSEGIGLVIQRLEIFSDYVQHLMKLPIQSKLFMDTRLAELYQKISSELKGLTDLLKESASKVKMAEDQLKKLQIVAQQQHDRFFATEENEQKKSQRLQKGWTKLAAILNYESAVSEIQHPKPEEKNSHSSLSTKDLCQIVLKKEEHDEHQVSAAVVQSNNEQNYLRLISKISTINPLESWQKQMPVETWQNQMRDFAQAMSDFSRSKDKAQVALTSSESKFILASRHDLMTQMQDSIGDHCTDFLDSYHAEMLTRNSSASPTLYEPESLESDWQIYGKIFNLVLDKLQSIWSVHAEQEDKWTAKMRADLNLMSKENTKISNVLSNLEKDAKALIEDISGIDNNAVITVYDRAIEKLRGFQGKLQSVEKDQKYTIKIYQDLWEDTLSGLLKNLQTYKDPVNAKAHDAGEAVQDLNKAEFDIINTLITRLPYYSQNFENRHAKFVNSGKSHHEVEDIWPNDYRKIAFDARSILKDGKDDLASLKENFRDLMGKIGTLHESFTSSENYKSLERQLTVLDDWPLKFEEEEQNLSENYSQELKKIETTYAENLETAYRRIDIRIGWKRFGASLLAQKKQSGVTWGEKSKFRDDERLKAAQDCQQDIANRKAAAEIEYNKKQEELCTRKENTEKTVIQKKIQLLIDCMDCYQPAMCSNPLSGLMDLLDNRLLYHKEEMADLTDNFLENLRIIITQLGGSDQASFYKNLSIEVKSNPDTIKRYKILRKYTNQILEWQTSPWSIREENPKKLNDRGSVMSLQKINNENLSAMKSLVSLLDDKPAEFELYIMSEFNRSKCNEVKRNSIILTNDNHVYFIIDNSLVLEDKKREITSGVSDVKGPSPAQRVSVNRQKLNTTLSGKPQLCTGKDREKMLIIKESLLRGAKENNRIFNKTQFHSGDRYTLKQVDQIIGWIEEKNESGADRLLVNLFRNYDEEKSGSFELKKSLTEFLKATQGVQQLAIMLLHSARQGGLSIKFNGPLYREIVEGCMGASLPKKRHLLKSKIVEQIRELMKIRLQIEDNFYVFHRAFCGTPAETKSDKPTQESLEKEFIKSFIDEGGIQYRLQLLRDKIAEMMIPVMEIYEKLNDQSIARRQLQKDLDLIYRTTGTGVKDQMALHDSVQNLRKIKLDPVRELLLDSKEISPHPSEEPKMFTILVNSFFSKVQANLVDLTAKLTRSSQSSRIAPALPVPAGLKEPIEMKSLEGMADVIAKIPGQPVTASVDLLFKDLTLTLSGPAPKTVDTLTTIADLKHPVSDLQPVSSEVPVSEPISLPTTGSQPMPVDTIAITITPITPLAQDLIPTTLPVMENPEINQVDQILDCLKAISRAKTDVLVPLPLLTLVNCDLLREFMEVFFSDVLNQDIIISTGLSGGNKVNMKRKEWSYGLERYFEEKLSDSSIEQKAMRIIVSSYVQIDNPDNKYTQEVFCKLPSSSLRSAVMSASRTLDVKKTKTPAAAVRIPKTKNLKEFTQKTAAILKTKFYIFEDIEAGKFNPPKLYPSNAHEYTQAIFLIHKKINKKDLYFPLIPGAWLKTLQNGTEVLKVFAKKKTKVITKTIQLDEAVVPATTDESIEDVAEIKLYSGQLPEETLPDFIPEESPSEIKRSEEPILVPKELLTLSFRPEDIQYEEKEKKLIELIKVDIEALTGLLGESYRQETTVIVERSILSLNNASIKVFLNIWPYAKMDAALEKSTEESSTLPLNNTSIMGFLNIFSGVKIDAEMAESKRGTIRDFFRQKLLEADEKQMSAPPSAKSQALRFLLNLPFHVLPCYNGFRKDSFFQLNADHFKINGLTDKADELFWIASFMALPNQLSSRFRDYLHLKNEVESKTSKLSDAAPQQKLSNYLKITVVRYQEGQSLATVTKNGTEAAIIYLFEDTTGCYPLVSTESLFLQPQRILELMREMDALKKIELLGSAQTIGVSGLTSPGSPSVSMTSPTASSTVSPISSIQSPGQVQSPEMGTLILPGIPMTPENKTIVGQVSGTVSEPASPSILLSLAQRLWSSPVVSSSSSSSSSVVSPSSPEVSASSIYNYVQSLWSSPDVNSKGAESAPGSDSSTSSSSSSSSESVVNENFIF